MFVLAVLCAVILNKTALGRYTFALGSNEEAARLSGVNVDRWKIIVYTFKRWHLQRRRPADRLAAELGTARAGPGLRAGRHRGLVIGGTSLSGGVGTIMGTVIGAFIMSVLIKWSSHHVGRPGVQMVLTGLIVILAVYADRMRSAQQ